MSDNGYRQHWTEVGVFVAMGNMLSYSDLYAIYDNVEIQNLDSKVLPGRALVVGTPTERKDNSFLLAETIWGITPGDWLKMENNWLKDSRSISGSVVTEGKDKIYDVVSTEILLGLISAAKLVTENRDGGDISCEAHTAVNLILAEACAKGRARMLKVEGTSVYSVLKNNGLMFGLGGGKYLPNPERSLPELLLMLRKSRIRPEVYLP